MAIVLYHHPFSRAANVVWMLEEVGADAELRYVDLQVGAQKSPEILALNPMTGLIAAIRQAVLGLPIDWVGVGISSVAAVVFFLIGCFYFRRMERNFADII